MNKSQKLICLTKSFCHVWSDYDKGRYGSVLASYHEIQVAHYGFGIVREYA